MELILIPIFAVAFMFLNRVRGGGYKKIPRGKEVASVGFGLAIGIATLDPISAVLCGGLYRIGAMWSWGQWVGASRWFFDKSKQGSYDAELLPKRDGRDSGIHFIVSRFVDQRKDFTRYCLACLFLRGIWWFAPVYAALAMSVDMNPLVAIAATLAAGVTMPLAYLIGGKTGKGYWGNGEKIYGAFYGAILGLSLLFVGKGMGVAILLQF